MQQDNASFWADIKKYEEQLATTPDSYCFARLSEIYLKVGLVDDALHAAQNGVRRHPGFLAGLKALAAACEARGMVSEQIAALKRITEMIPDDTHSQRSLARLLAAQGDMQGARQALGIALDFAPDDASSREELEALDRLTASAAAVEAVEGDEEIIEELEVIEELDILEDEDELQAASDEPGLAFEAGGGESAPLATVTLAELYEQQGFADKARDVYREILGHDPANSVAAERLAALEGRHGDGAPAEPESVRSQQAEDLSAGDDIQPAVFTTPASLHADLGAVPMAGAADNVVETLEGWLETIRRIKACR